MVVDFQGMYIYNHIWSCCTYCSFVKPRVAVIYLGMFPLTGSPLEVKDCDPRRLKMPVTVMLVVVTN